MATLEQVKAFAKAVPPASSADYALFRPRFRGRDLSGADLRTGLFAALEKLGPRRRVLAVPRTSPGFIPRPDA